MSAAVDVSADYAAAGFEPFPLPAGEKFPPPLGVTGRDGTAYAGEIPTGENVGIRMPAWCIGLDIDGTDHAPGKLGPQSIAEAEATYGTLPATVYSTRHGGDSDTRILLFEVPEGAVLSERPLAGVEIIQRGHRYMVAAPSTLADGTAYEWFDGSTGEVLDMPTRDRIEKLPDAWLEFLTRPTFDAVPEITDATVAEFLDLCETSGQLLAMVDFEDAPLVAAPDGSMVLDTTSDDGLYETLKYIVRHGIARGPDVRQVVGETHRLWMARKHRSGDPEDRFRYNLRRAVGFELDRIGGIEAMRTRAQSWADLPPLPDMADLMAALDAKPEGSTFAGIEPLTGMPLFEGGEAWGEDPESLWRCARPEIEHIYATAKRRKLSPWALLAATLTRAATLVPHTVAFRSFLGRRPVNMIAAVSGPTGAGKSVAESVVSEAFIWPGDLPPLTEPGSGEAIASAFGFIADKDDPEFGIERGDLLWRRTDHAARLYFDEIGRLNAIQNRQGATVLEYLKTGESGGDLGRVLASFQGVQIPAGCYRMTATLNVQPERAHLILSEDEAAGGFAGRMLWASTTYLPFVGIARDRSVAEAWPLASLDWAGVHNIDALPEMEDAFEAQQDASLAGDLDPLESHSALLRAKVAICLMVLDGRQALMSDDWRLAGLVLEHSRRVRDAVLAKVAETRGAERAERQADIGATVRRNMADYRAEGDTMTMARRRLRSDRRPIWDALTEADPDLIW